MPLAPPAFLAGSAPMPGRHFVAPVPAGSGSTKVELDLICHAALYGAISDRAGRQIL